MRFPAPGRFRTLADFCAHAAAVAPDVEVDTELEGVAGPLGAPLALFGRTLGNRFAIHPMEGWDGTSEGLPSELTLRRWKRFGASGADLVWGGEAFAVQADGRANPQQLFLNDAADVPRALSVLRAAVLEGRRVIGGDPDALCLGLQLTHSGRWARPTSAGPAPRIADRHPVLDARLGLAPDAPLLTDGELEGIAERYVGAARLAREAGFDFVDVKACHGYLVHELLGARTRPGPYGGSFEHRTRFLLQTIRAVQAACPGLGVGVRLSLGELAPHGPDASGVGAPQGWRPGERYEQGFGVDPADPRRIELTEGLQLAALLCELGVAAVNVTLGSPYTCPHLQRPAAYPPSDGYEPPADPLAEVAEHLRAARALKAAVPELVVVGTGYTYLQEWLPHVAQREVRGGHVDLVGLGRMVLSYPELPRDVLAGRALDRRRLCRTFSDCTTAPRHGLVSGCYPLDELYRARPEATELADVKASLRARRAAREERA